MSKLKVLRTPAMVAKANRERAMGRKNWKLGDTVADSQFSPLFTPVTADARQVGGSHYKDMGVQPWDAMQSWMSQEEFVGMLRGNAIKYVARCNAKGGVEDIKKARHYLDKLIEVLEGV